VGGEKDRGWFDIHMKVEVLFLKIHIPYVS